VLGRTTFGPFPGQVADALDRGMTTDDLVDDLLGRTLPFAPSAYDASTGQDLPVDVAGPDVDDLRVYMAFRDWWLARMRSDEAGVHEKMMWFWHTHLTTSLVKVDSTNLCWRQLATLHEHALGNFRDLLLAMTLDAAMLRYLDGDGSIARSPNENYARELMELFTLGLGAFDQRDVSGAAIALSGWRVGDDLGVRFDADDGPSGPVRVLGRAGIEGVEGLIDAILARDECAPFLVGRIWHHLVGSPAPSGVVDSLARRFRRSGYRIGPLVEQVLRHDELAAPGPARARTPLEWYLAASRTIGLPRATSGHLDAIGQSPYRPPNVSGWPGDAAWLSPTQAHGRAALLLDLPVEVPADVSARADVVDAVLDHCSLVDVGSRTRAALDDLARQLDGTADRAATLVRAALLSPEAAYT
jgi:uncharacterized protein (DUF1800 family)